MIDHVDSDDPKSIENSPDFILSGAPLPPPPRDSIDGPLARKSQSPTTSPDPDILKLRQLLFRYGYEQLSLKDRHRVTAEEERNVPEFQQGIFKQLSCRRKETICIVRESSASWYLGYKPDTAQWGYFPRTLQIADRIDHKLGSWQRSPFSFLTFRRKGQKLAGIPASHILFDHRPNDYRILGTYVLKEKGNGLNKFDHTLDITLSLHPSAAGHISSFSLKIYLDIGFIKTLDPEEKEFGSPTEVEITTVYDKEHDGTAHASIRVGDEHVGVGGGFESKRHTGRNVQKSLKMESYGRVTGSGKGTPMAQWTFKSNAQKTALPVQHHLSVTVDACPLIVGYAFTAITVNGATDAPDDMGQQQHKGHGAVRVKRGGGD